MPNVFVQSGPVFHGTHESSLDTFLITLLLEVPSRSGAVSLPSTAKDGGTTAYVFESL